MARSDRSVRKRACRLVGPDEHARLSGVADELLDRRVGVGRREEPPRYESGFRAHGSNQRFHRLLRHAVARALTTAPSLAGVSPAAADILIRHRWRRKGRPGRCRINRRNHVARATVGRSELILTSPRRLGPTRHSFPLVRATVVPRLIDAPVCGSVFFDSLASKRQ